MTARPNELEEKTGMPCDESLYGIAVDLAYALRLAVTTEFLEPRRVALERWEKYIRNLP